MADGELHALATTFVKLSNQSQSLGTRATAEAALLSFRSHASAVPTCRLVLDGDAPMVVHFQAVNCVRDVALTQWARMSSAMRSELTEYLMRHVFHRAPARAVRAQMLQTVVLLQKRGWSVVEDAQRAAFLQSVRSLFAAQDAVQTSLGLEIVALLVAEFGSTKSSAMGMTERFHKDSKLAFERAGLLECYQLTSAHASQIAQHAVRGGATAAAQSAALTLALDVTADILSWQFGSWSTANGVVYPPQAWRPHLLRSTVPAALFALYGALRAEAARRSLLDGGAAAAPPQPAFEAGDDQLRALLRNARRCMIQFASLHGRKLFADDNARLSLLAALIPGVGALAAASAASIANSAAAPGGSGTEDDADGGGFAGDEATDTSVMVLRLVQNFGFKVLARAAGLAELLATFSSLAAQLLRTDASRAATSRAEALSDVAAQPAAERPSPTELYAHLAGEGDQSWRMRAFDTALDCWGLLANVSPPPEGWGPAQSVASALKHQAAALASQLVSFRLELSRGAAAATADALSRGIVRDSAAEGSSSAVAAAAAAAAAPSPPPTNAKTALLMDSDADDERPSLDAVSGRGWFAEQTEAAAFLGRLRAHDSMSQLVALMRERAAAWAAAQRGSVSADGGVTSAAAACELACVLLSASCAVADMPEGERPVVPQEFLADIDGGASGGATAAETAAAVNAVLAISSELLQLAGSVLEWLSRAPDAVAFTWANRILLRALLLFLLRWSATYLTMEPSMYRDSPLPAALHSAFIVSSADPAARGGGVPALTATAASAVNVCVQLCTRALARASWSLRITDSAIELLWTLASSAKIGRLLPRLDTWQTLLATAVGDGAGGLRRLLPSAPPRCQRRLIDALCRGGMHSAAGKGSRGGAAVPVEAQSALFTSISASAQAQLQQMVSLASSSNREGSPAARAPSVEEARALLDVLQLYRGVSCSGDVSDCASALVRPFILRAIPHISVLVGRHAHSPDGGIAVAIAVFKLLRDFCKSQLVYLDSASVQLVCSATASAISAFARCCGAGCYAGGAADAESQLSSAVVVLLLLLTELMTKDLFDFSDEAAPVAAGGAGAGALPWCDVVEMGLQVLLPLLTPPILRYQRVTRCFFSLIAYYAEHHIDRLAALPFAFFSALTGALSFGLTHVEPRTASLAMSAIADLAQYHAKGTPGLAAQLAQAPKLLKQFLEQLFQTVLFEPCDATIVPRAANAAISLIACAPGHYHEMVTALLAQQPDPGLRALMADAFTRLTSENGVTLESTDRLNRVKFRKNFALFVTEIRSCVSVR